MIEKVEDVRFSTFIRSEDTHTFYVKPAMLLIIFIISNRAHTYAPRKGMKALKTLTVTVIPLDHACQMENVHFYLCKMEVRSASFSV
jgi:hypothetical protein